MEPLIAAVVLAWIVIVLLAFAMAGILYQVRALQDAFVRQSDAGGVASQELPDEVKPQAGKSYAALLLVDESCAICAEVVPVFAEMAETAEMADGTGDVDFALLSREPAGKLAVAGVRTIVDGEAYHLIDPGWRPALVVVGRDGDVLAAEPAGSADALRDGLGRFTKEIVA